MSNFNENNNVEELAKKVRGLLAERARNAEETQAAALNEAAGNIYRMELAINVPGIQYATNAEMPETVAAETERMIAAYLEGPLWSLINNACTDFGLTVADLKDAKPSQALPLIKNLKL